MKSTTKLAPAAAVIGAVLAARAFRRREAIDFRGMSVVITGSSRGLGLVLARKLAAEGARLTLLARDGEELERARADVAAYGGEVYAFPCDVRERVEAEGAILRAIDHYGRIDVLINNAGVIQVGPVEHMELEDFEDAMAIHFWGPLYTMFAAVPHMRKQGSGRIVNISSIGGKVAAPHLTPYSASKFALVGLSDGMRNELAKDGIKVTTVAPGLMRTGSPPNAFFKGQHSAEYAWFTISDANPLLSTSAESAARQIIDACRHGDAQLVITLRAKALVVLNALFPELTAAGMALGARLLTGPTGEEGDKLRTGWESQSEAAPSLLTRLSDQATEENNELRGHDPIVEP